MTTAGDVVVRHLTPCQVFITHGGLFTRDDVRLDEIKAIRRGREPPDSGLHAVVVSSNHHGPHAHSHSVETHVASSIACLLSLLQA